eukprot:3323951-Rhodomonas_salina.2
MAAACAATGARQANRGVLLHAWSVTEATSPRSACQHHRRPDARTDLGPDPSRRHAAEAQDAAHEVHCAGL